MILTGAALIAFELYMLNNYNCGRNIQGRLKISLDDRSVHFDNLPDSMRYGVIVDWGDSVGITSGLFTYTSYTPVIYRGYAGNKACESSKTRPEARTAAVQKLSELYNNQER